MKIDKNFQMLAYKPQLTYFNRLIKVTKKAMKTRGDMFLHCGYDVTYAECKTL